MEEEKRLVVAFQEALDGFKAGYLSVRGMAEGSQVEYQTDVGQLLLFLQGRGVRDLAAISSRHIEAYVAALEQEGIAVATRRKKIFAVKSFFTWLVATKRLAVNPAGRVIPPERVEKAPRILTAEERTRLLAAITNTRDLAIIQVLLATGVTLSEIAHLTLSDLYDLNISTHVTSFFGTAQINRKAHGTLHVPGSKVRTVPLNRDVSEALIAWLEERPHAESDALFLSSRLQPLSVDGYQYIVEGYFKAAGIEGANVQTLRNTFTVDRLRAGDSPERVKKLLGTQSLHVATLVDRHA